MDFERNLLNFKDLEQRVNYASTLPEKLVLDLCSKNTELNQTVCLNEEYWKIRYLKKSENPPTTEPKSWKKLHLFSDINEVLSFGSNNYGQLGLGDGEDRNIPTQIPSDIKAKQIACGGQHSMIIDTDSNSWSFGKNYNGQLGLGDNTERVKPTQIPNIKAKQIACGGEHSMIIDMNGDLWSFGQNIFGQLGLEDNENRNKPTQIPNIKAKQIACGENHSMIIDLNDNVWSFGFNYGRLGLGDYTRRNKPTQIPNIKAKQIACGYYHSMIIDLNNNVWSFGHNDKGQLGLGDYEHRNKPTQIPGIKAKQISCGEYHSMIIDTDNNGWSFGDNYSGRLGLEDDTDRNIPTQIQMASGIKAIQIACGREHSMILTSNPTLLSFDEITNMFSQGQVTDFEIEHNLQIPYKALQGIYIGTFTDKQGQTKYGYIRYNQETNQILKP